jgi:predicted DNA binding protein
MLDILTATATKDGAAQAFCDHLVEERGYACAWIGLDGDDAPITQTGGLVPWAVAGEQGYVDAVIDADMQASADAEPARAAMATTSSQVVSIDPAATAAGWRDIAGAYGFEWAAATPVTHDGSVMGVLAVYAPHAGRTADVDLLEEYSRSIGAALRTAEWRESVLSTAAIAVDVELDGAAVPLVATSRHLPTDASIDVLTTVPRSETFLYVVHVQEATAEAVRDAADRVADVVDVSISAADGPISAELAVSLPTPESVVATNGGRVVETTVEHGRASVTVVCPEEGHVESLVDAVREVYPSTGVRALRSSGVAATSATASDPLEPLTEKQRQAMELAYYNGYFERPREHDATEVASKLGVSRQTFTQHLRAAQRKVLSELF